MPGVMITQFMEELPEGMTTPDFTRKPIALTIQEGKSHVISQMLHNTIQKNVLRTDLHLQPTQVLLRNTGKS